LKSKIHHAKQSTRGNESGGGGGNREKRIISLVEYDDMRSQVSTLHEELMQVRAVMQASRDNENTSTTDGESAASAFGRPGLPPSHKKKRQN
jgi:hypothetical protein